MNRPYIPAAFGASSLKAKKIIGAHPFATFITVHGGEAYVTQIPMVFRNETTLIGHMARANPHSAALLAETLPVQATMQFTGVNGYISPAWYAVNTGVPTWNYETVQARGAVKLMADLPATESVVKALIDAFDTQADVVKQAWADLPSSAQDAQLGAILAFEVRLSECIAKTKLSQNRPMIDRPRIIAALEAGNNNDKRMAAAVREATTSAVGAVS
jgi:transcriptional regulator